MTAALLLPGPHQPERPGWNCAECHQPFPCPRAQTLLRQAHGPGLPREMAAMLDVAAADQLGSPAQLWERFIAWTCPVPATPEWAGGPAGG